MKRVVSSSIISVVILLLIAGGFFYFQLTKSDSASVYEVIPSDVAWVVSADPSSGDLQRLARSSFFSGSDTVPVLKEWHSSLLYFDSLCVNNPDLKNAFADAPLLISGHVTGPSAFSLMFFMPMNSGLVNMSEELVKKILKSGNGVTSRNFNGVDIKEIATNGGGRFSWAISKGIFIASSTPYLIEDAIRQQKNTASVSPAGELKEFIDDKPKSLMVAVHYAGFSRWLKTQFRTTSAINLAPLERLGDWSVLRLDLHTNIISFTGQTLAADTTTFIRVFNDQKPVKRTLIEWLPAKTAAAVMWGVSNPSGFLETIKTYRRNIREDNEAAELIPYFRDWLGAEIGLVVTQPVGSLNDNNFMAILAVKDSAKCLHSLEALAGAGAVKEELYNGYSIRYIDRKSILENLFGALFVKVNRFFYTRINHHMVIANQASVLRAYINDVKTNNMLVNEDRYQTLAPQVPASGNLLFYCSIPQSEKLFSTIAAPAWVTWLAQYGEVLNNWNGLTFSVSNLDGVYSTTGCLGYFNKNATGPQLAWNVKLDTTIASGPFMPAGIGGLIFAQDVLQNLYAYDASGNLKWKKKLETQLRSEVFAVDYYKNGGKQYLFNSHSFIYLLDSSGTNVGNYPFRLPAEASAGMTIAKGNNGDNEKIYISCTNLRMYAFDVSGKPLTGFSPMKLPAIISRPVFYNEKTEMLVLLAESGVCFVADKSGNRLYTVKGTIELNDEKSFFYVADTSLLFGFLSKEGKVFTVDTKGEIKQLFENSEDVFTDVANGDLNGDSIPDWVLSSSKGLVAETNDGVTLFKFKTDQSVTSVAFHTVNKKVFLSAISAGRMYLFNRDGTLFEGFPLSGYSIPVAEKGEGGEKYLLVRGGDDNFSLYQLP